MADGFDARPLFELYLYDYFMKHNMRKTAEIFRREAAMAMDPMTSEGINVPEGFLLEWWSVFYDMYRTDLKSLYPEETTSTMPMNVSQQTGASLSAASIIDGEMIKNLALSSDNVFMRRDYSMSSGFRASTETDQAPQNLHLPLQIPEMSTSELCSLPIPAISISDLPSRFWASMETDLVSPNLHRPLGIPKMSLSELCSLQIPEISISELPSGFRASTETDQTPQNLHLPLQIPGMSISEFQASTEADAVHPELGNYVLNSFSQKNQRELKAKMLPVERATRKRGKRPLSGSSSASRGLVFPSEDSATNDKLHDLNALPPFQKDEAGVSSVSLHGYSSSADDSGVLEVKESSRRE